MANGWRDRPIETEIRTYVRSFLAETGMMAEQLCEILGISPSTMSGWVNGYTVCRSPERVTRGIDELRAHPVAVRANKKFVAGNTRPMTRAEKNSRKVLQNWRRQRAWDREQYRKERAASGRAPRQSFVVTPTSSEESVFRPDADLFRA